MFGLKIFLKNLVQSKLCSFYLHIIKFHKVFFFFFLSVNHIRITFTSLLHGLSILVIAESKKRS